MKFCANCGNGNEDDSKFCRKCGATFGGADTVIAQPPPPPPPETRPAASYVPPAAPATGADTGTSSLAPNVAHFLCYVAGWITGVVFLVIETKDRDTRFHAWQSIIALGGMSLIAMAFYLIFSFIAAARMFGISVYLGWVINAILILIYILSFVLWIVLMVKAFQGENYHLAIAGPIAHNLAYKDSPAQSQPRPQPQPQPQPKPQPQKTQAPAAPKYDLPPAPPARKVDDRAQATKFCIACGESLPQKAMFCSRCGERQP